MELRKTDIVFTLKPTTVQVWVYLTFTLYMLYLLSGKTDTHIPNSGFYLEATAKIARGVG